MTSSDSGCGGPFWERKMRTFFKRMDVDGNGYLTKEDYERIGDLYVEVGQLDAVKAKQARRKLIKIWYDYFESDSTNGKVNEADYIRAVRNRKSLIFETTMQIQGLFFDIIDLNGDGIIQKEEFAIFYKVLGIKDEKVAAQCFKALDTNGDGLLSYDEFTHAGYNFFYSGDESLPSKFLYGPLIEE